MRKKLCCPGEMTYEWIWPARVTFRALGAIQQRKRMKLKKLMCSLLKNYDYKFQ